VYGVVVLVAEWDEVAQVGGSAVFPFVDVMGLAPGQGPLTAVPYTGAVQGSEAVPLGVGGGAVFAANINRDPVLVDHNPL
jgi:hypothetical protein